MHHSQLKANASLTKEWPIIHKRSTEDASLKLRKNNVRWEKKKQSHGEKKIECEMKMTNGAGNMIDGAGKGCCIGLRWRWRRDGSESESVVWERWVRVLRAFCKLGFRVKLNPGYEITRPDSQGPTQLKCKNSSSTTTLFSARDPDYGKRKKRPWAWSKHGRPPETRKVVRPYDPALVFDYIGHNQLWRREDFNNNHHHKQLQSSHTLPSVTIHITWVSARPPIEPCNRSNHCLKKVKSQNWEIEMM
jgi:hypothetical protein